MQDKATCTNLPVFKKANTEGIILRMQRKLILSLLEQSLTIKYELSKCPETATHTYYKIKFSCLLEIVTACPMAPLQIISSECEDHQHTFVVLIQGQSFFPLPLRVGSLVSCLNQQYTVCVWQGEPCQFGFLLPTEKGHQEHTYGCGSHLDLLAS